MVLKSIFILALIIVIVVLWRVYEPANTVFYVLPAEGKTQVRAGSEQIENLSAPYFRVKTLNNTILTNEDEEPTIVLLIIEGEHKGKSAHFYLNEIRLVR